MTADTPRAHLGREPRRFGFDAAVRVLQHAAGSTEPAVVARVRSAPHLAYPGADVLGLQDGEGVGAPPVVVVGAIGMVGSTGVLPRGYTEQVTTATRERSPSLHAFIDLLADRLVAHFAAAGAKYRPARAAEVARLDGGADRIARVLLSLTGYATPGLPERLACGTAPLLHYSGFFASRPRAADRLESMASDWLGRPVEVVQFAGAWLDVPPSQRTALPMGRMEGAFCRLGEDASVGVRAWDVQGRVVLRVGPLQGAGFAELLPGGVRLGQFVALVRAYLGLETGFAVNLVVAPGAVPVLRLDAAAGPRLGWNTWLPGERAAPADEPLFEAEVVEAETGLARAA
jgi:type VI secretion system protein ImpH